MNVVIGKDVYLISILDKEITHDKFIIYPV